MWRIQTTESFSSIETSTGLEDSSSTDLILSNTGDEFASQKKKNLVTRPWRTCVQLYERCGPRTTVLIGAISTIVVFLINIALVVWALMKGHGERHVFAASCNSVQFFSTSIHILINALSAILLGASNFAMQILCAPSRSDIDRAHAKNRWMNIGVQSPRNLLRLSWSNLSLWMILALSSIPLHLMYNSIFFSTMTDHYYDVYFASDDWLHSSSFDQTFYPHLIQNGSHWMYPSDWNYKMLPITGPGTSETPSMTISDGRWPHQTNPHVLQHHLSKDLSRYDTLSPTECIQRYSPSYVSAGSNLILIGNIIDREAFRDKTQSITSSTLSGEAEWANSRGVDLNSSLLNIIPGKGSTFDPFTSTDSLNWFCDRSYSATPNCERQQKFIDHSKPFNWTLIGFNITECASQKPKDQCALNINRELAVVVMAMNLLKAIALITVYLKLKHHPILTFGDAVASFMSIPDETTQNLCLTNRQYFNEVERHQKRTSKDGHEGEKDHYGTSKSTARRSNPLRYLRYHEFQFCQGNFAGVDSCTAYGCFWTLCFATTCALLISTCVSEDTLGPGLDEVFSAELIRSWALSNNVAATTIVANLPQAILSGLYVLLNNFVTRICMGIEWSKFSRNRQALRVSSNMINAQRSTHFLHLPLRYSALILSTSGLLHWLASQSFYFVEVDTYDASGKLYSVVQTCGFSRLAIGLVLMIMFLIFIATVAFSRWKVNVSMPFAGSCSKAIAAACHSPDKGNDPSLEIQWGAIPDAPERWIKINGELRPVGHCSFSSGDVEPPVEGALYA